MLFFLSCAQAAVRLDALAQATVYCTPLLAFDQHPSSLCACPTRTGGSAAEMPPLEQLREKVDRAVDAKRQELAARGLELKEAQEKKANSQVRATGSLGGLMAW